MGCHQSPSKIIRSKSHQIQSDITTSKPSPAPAFTLIDIRHTFSFPSIHALHLPQSPIERHLATHISLTTDNARPNLLQPFLRTHPPRSSVIARSIRLVYSP